jgi:processive 1,2-diacylglycerol beta-glucosyltransferase
MPRVKILIAYENGAGGHRAAALAVKEALDDFGDLDSLALELDQLAPRYRKQMYTTFMDIRPFFGPIVRFAFGFGMRPSLPLKLYAGFGAITQPWGLRKFLDVVDKEAPDLILSTHFRVNLVCNQWLERGQLRTPVHSLVPDFVAHGIYPQPRIQRYYVASEAVRDDLMRSHIDPARIVVTGIPVSKKLCASVGTREQIRLRLGLAPDLPVLLIMGGTRGDGDYGSLLRELEARRPRAQVVVLCGKNERLKVRLRRFSPGSSEKPVRLEGYQTNMSEWYGAADLLLTKPGGMTISEALNLGKATLLHSPQPGKEEVQAERIAAAGWVRLERSPRNVVEAAIRILGDPTEIRRMEAAAQSYGQPDAAGRIAKKVATAARELRSRRP